MKNMDQNIMKEILSVEDEANNIIYDAKKKTRQIELEMEKKLEGIIHDLEMEYNDKIKKLKARRQSVQMEEERRLREEFEEVQYSLKHTDQKVKESVDGLVFKKLCEVV